MDSSEPPLSVAESDMMDISPAPTTASTTVISNLDDACLLAVFQHMVLADLCAIADVCHRFRENSRTHYSSPKFGNNGLRLECSNGYCRIFPRACCDCSSDEARVKYSDEFVPIQTVLRIFGNLIHSIRIKSDSTISGLKFAKSVLDRISLHCSGTLIDLDLISSSAPTTASSTKITNLDDACLLAVFQHMALADLCAIADVCRRFRENARTHFSSLKFRNNGSRIECSNGYCRIFQRACCDYSLDKARVKYADEKVHIPTVFRIFGNLIHSIRIKSDSTISGLKFAKRVLDRINLHCSGTLIDLDLIECAIDAKIELAVRPLLSNLQTLSLDDSEYGELIGQMFSLCSSLRKLHFLHPRSRLNCSEARFDDILRLPFPKLELISFRDVSSVKNNDIEDFLKLNPRLKKIEVLNCKNLDGTIFLPIAMYTPHIENIHIDAVTRRIKDKNLNYFGKLSSLSTLKLDLSDKRVRIVDSKFMSTILHEIREAEIPLQHLHIKTQYSSKYCNTRKLRAVISELKTLKTLWLYGVPRLTLSHAVCLCKELEQLSELILFLHKEVEVTRSTVAEYVEIAERHQNNRLVFKITCCCPFGCIPRDIRRTYIDSFKVISLDEYTMPYFTR